MLVSPKQTHGGITPGGGGIIPCGKAIDGGAIPPPYGAAAAAAASSSLANWCCGVNFPSICRIVEGGERDATPIGAHTRSHSTRTHPIVEISVVLSMFPSIIVLLAPLEGVMRQVRIAVVTKVLRHCGDSRARKELERALLKWNQPKHTSPLSQELGFTNDFWSGI